MNVLKKNKNIFLNLLLQLLTEYGYMFDINKNNSQNIKNVNPFVSTNPFTSTIIFGTEQGVNNTGNIYNNKDDDDNTNDNKNFLSIINFLGCKSQSVETLLNTKEQIIDTVKIIRDYCDNDIKC